MQILLLEHSFPFIAPLLKRFSFRWFLALACVLAFPAIVCAQGTLTCNQMYFGSIAKVGESNVWSFTANAGDSVIVRLAPVELTGTNSMGAVMQLYNPAGALVSQDGGYANKVLEVSSRATNGGTFTLVVIAVGQPGAYHIDLASTGCPAVATPGGGGPMTNGFRYTGFIDVGGLGSWSFNANAGDAIVVRIGNLTNGSPLLPNLRLYGPDGALLNSVSGYGYQAEEVTARAVTKGTFMVLVAGGGAPFGRPDGSGPYRLTLFKTGDPVVTASGDEGGPMTNGFMHTGMIDLGDADIWTFNAKAGDGIFVRMGNLTTNGTLDPYLRLYGPDGSLASSVGGYGYKAEDLSVRAATNGIYSVVLTGANVDSGGSGPYRLTLAKTGDPIVTASGDEGGSMTNGFMHTGNIDFGDVDVWTFNAKAGESFFVQMGNFATNGTLDPWLRVYAPNGFLADPVVGGYGYKAEGAGARASTNGAFMVLISGGNFPFGGIGQYRVTLAKTGDPIVTAPGDEGGPLTNGFMHMGKIDLGDADVWSVDAKTGDSIVVRMGDLSPTNALDPYLRLYGPDGQLLEDIGGYGYIAEEATTRATTNGTYLVVLTGGSGTVGGTGPYRMTLAKTRAPIVIAAGDEGGLMTNGHPIIGSIPIGDLDVWTLVATNTGSITINIHALTDNGGFVPWVRVYGTNGALLASSLFSGTSFSLNVTNDQELLVVVADAGAGYSRTGTYQLSYFDSSIGHVVLVMMENRSFDHLLGWLGPAAEGKQSFAFPDRNGNLVSTYPLAPDFSGWGHLDPDHSYIGGRIEFDTNSATFGKCDGWLLNPSNDLFSIGYYRSEDLPFFSQVVTNWTICSNYFAAIMAETQPNRIYQHAAQTDRMTNRLKSDWLKLINFVYLPTIWDRLKDSRLNGRYYSDGTFTALQYWGTTYIGVGGISYGLSDFYHDCAAGTLPEVSFVDPNLTTDDSSPGNDDHPFGNIQDGERFLASVYNSVVHSPNWSNTVLIINFDEWGGFFDHVRPPAVSPAEVAPADILAYHAVGIGPTDPTYGLRGFRVPCLVISPWSHGPRFAAGLYDHTSVLKLIEDRWGLLPLTTRDGMANNLAEVLDFQNPDPTPPPQITIPDLIGLAKDNNNNLWISWDPLCSKLQTKSLLSDAWTDVPTINSPYQVNMGLSPSQFFRVVRTCP